jgi:hypothetical protein
LADSGRLFGRVVISLVREGTLLKIAVEGYENQGCFTVIRDYAKEVLDGRREKAYGIWLVEKRGRA